MMVMYASYCAVRSVLRLCTHVRTELSGLTERSEVRGLAALQGSSCREAGLLFAFTLCVVHYVAEYVPTLYRILYF